MIVGVGTDIVEIERISRLLEKNKMQFVKRILSSSELVEFELQAHPEKFLAKRWAAKEAVSKALGTGFSQGVAFNDIAIEHLETGQPYIEVFGKTAQLAESMNISRWSLSISDEKRYAVAFVIAESD